MEIVLSKPVDINLNRSEVKAIHAIGELLFFIYSTMNDYL